MQDSTNNGKRKRLSLPKKITLIQSFESETSQAQLARDYDVGKSTVTSIIGSRDKIQMAYKDNPKDQQKSLKGAEKYVDVDEPLYEWFVNNRAAKKEITEHLILAAAKKISQRLNHPVDAINESWVQRWRQRHGIHYIMLHGEGADCPDFTPWMNWVKSILDQYALKDIYNWDAAALFWRSSSSASFVTANEEIVKGRKKMKARVTILTGVSMAV